MELNVRKSDPTLKDLLDIAKRDVLLSTNCHKIATIQSFDPETYTCKASINWKRSVMVKQQNGTYVEVARDYPVLAEVPVLHLSSSNGLLGVNVPVKIGDQALICFNDQDIGNWYIKKLNAIPDSNKLHSFSDGVAIVGLSFKSDGGFYDPDRVSIFNGETVVGVSESLVKIANAQHDLKTLLEELITNVKSLVTQTAAITVPYFDDGSPAVSGPPVNSVAITQISTLLDQTNTKIGQLLE